MTGVFTPREGIARRVGAGDATDGDRVAGGVSTGEIGGGARCTDDCGAVSTGVTLGAPGAIRAVRVAKGVGVGPNCERLARNARLSDAARCC